MKNGVDDGARTHDNRNHNPGLYQLSYVHHKQNGAPGRIRTCYPRLRRPMLYPIELQAQYLNNYNSIQTTRIWSGARELTKYILYFAF